MEHPGYIATVGTFDGIHRGHAEVIQMLGKYAGLCGLTPLIITFSSHPLEIIAPLRAPKLLMPSDEKLRRLAESGIKVIPLRFTSQMASMTARQWLTDLRNNHHVKAILLGYDNTFGSDGRFMTHDDYRWLGEELGLKVFQAPEIEGVSSSKARRAVAQGDMERAADILGRPFRLSGIVEHGNQIGRTIGVPTANLALSDPTHTLLPPPGAYAAIAAVADGRTFPAVVNIGVRPTLDKSLQTPSPRIEAHLLDFAGNLYDTPLDIDLIRHLRPEKKFPDLQALKSAIAGDILSTKKILNLNI